jgi:hypothetical protein
LDLQSALPSPSVGMPKTAAPVPVPSASPVDLISDVFLFTGDFKFFFYVCLAGFCACNARTVLTASPKINFWHGCALMVLSCYGGSTLSAIMIGKPVAFVCNEALVSVCLATWTVMYFVPKPTIAFLKDTSLGAVVASVTYEIMRCHVLMNCTKQAAATLPSALAVPAPDRVAIVGPLIAGLLGGCGGGFMPLNKGLDPLANGYNWRIGSAFVISIWMFLSTQYPVSKDMIGVSEKMARTIAVGFFAVMPLVEMAIGLNLLGPNPLVAAKATSAKKKQ